MLPFSFTSADQFMQFKDKFVLIWISEFGLKLPFFKNKHLLSDKQVHSLIFFLEKSKEEISSILLQPTTN